MQQPYNDNLPLEELQKKAYATIAWYFQEKSTPTGLYSKIGQIPDKIDTLNNNLAKASESSDRLTTALNRITLAAAVIAGLGVLIAGGSLALDILEYVNAR